MMNPMSILQNAAANSPIGRINQMVQAGNNPQALLQMMIQQNPNNKGIPFIQGKNSQQLQTTFCNLCKQHRIYPQAAVQQFCMNSPNGGSNT